MVLITIENIHEQMINFINNDKIEVKNYDSMTEVYLKMIEKDYHFAMDRDLIKEVMVDLAYKFCKKFNCPPYPSLQDTPVETIDIFNIIDQEIEQFSSKEK